MICRHCKANNPGGMRFCSSCGKPLLESNKESLGIKREQHKTTIDRILLGLCLLSVTTAVMFSTVGTHYYLDFAVTEETCYGHCVRMRASVRSQLLGELLKVYRYETFNLVPPCPVKQDTENSSGFASLLKTHKPFNDENKARFINDTVNIYKEYSKVYCSICAGIAILCGIGRYFLKKRKN